MRDGLIYKDDQCTHAGSPSQLWKVRVKGRWYVIVNAWKSEAKKPKKKRADGEGG